ncbi:adhesive plaque matrix protein 2-like [Ostrea edulis]|uniref:adhesive plaque matrix protein 2-like n=1 Tax=Ostrea edulis TaxID=37623 RepID=UPI0024AFADB2|nr:adhesive plaque matrix protein 2-like [Ostrea edulis]
MYPKPNRPSKWGNAPLPRGRNMCKMKDSCRNGGICKSSSRTRSGWKCECRNGWAGSRCTKKNYCPKGNVCMNGGSCVNSAIPGLFWRCKCRMGFSGRRCDKMKPKPQGSGGKLEAQPDPCGAEGRGPRRVCW